MKAKKLLDRLATFFDAEKRAQQEQADSIKKVLKKLKKKERDLKERLEEEESDAKREKLRTELEIIFAQRTKGVQLLKELRTS